ncbi:exodeoxyribonuclease V subunit alpha [Orbaceae bacterium ESL0727]|nr:exodeoxyribonuclease V subunit alpha [Orbaceae bacterium ESL0727]
MLNEWLSRFTSQSDDPIVSQKLGTISLLDIHLVLFLTTKASMTDETVMRRLAFLILLLSKQVRAGHVCLDLAHLTQYEHEPQLWQALGKPSGDDWQTVLQQAQQRQLVSDGTVLTPLVWLKDKLYFHRMWFDEKEVAAYFKRHHQATDAVNHTTSTTLTPPMTNRPNHSAISIIKSILDKLFVDTAAETTDREKQENQTTAVIDWQKVAVAMALLDNVTIISGGPGTGKTTTVAKIIAGILLMQPSVRIVAAAPTGKAASRLTESLTQAMAKLAFTNMDMRYEAITLHRLLGAKAESRHFTYNKHNPLHLDLLIIDEASMVDLNMMARVIEALPDSARLILLGDKDQLSSVEAGAVFGDLCGLVTRGYSHARATELTELTGYAIPYQQNALLNQPNRASLADSLCLLQKSYRFNDASGIGRLANAINEGKITAVRELLSDSALTDIHYHNLALPNEYPALLSESVIYYRDYLASIKQYGTQNIGQILQKFAQYRLLCAVRDGLFGVAGLNQQIESHLAQQGLIDLHSNDSWYIGRPIMILRNSVTLGLYNGDIGITLLSESDQDVASTFGKQKNPKLRVYFPFSDGSIKGFSPYRLPAHETAYAMTVHKSQGSEFDHISLILPTDYVPILNRSLLYTAITRAKKTAAIYATEAILAQTVKTETERQSGLVDLL